MPPSQTTVATLIPSQRHLFEIPDDVAAAKASRRTYRN